MRKNMENIHYYIYAVQFSRLVVSNSTTPWTAALQASLSITNSWSLLKPCPLSQWCHPTISSSVVPFSSCLQSCPALRSFPMSQSFISGSQSTGVSASASVLPMNIQDRFPLGWIGWISLQSEGLSRVFSNSTVQRHQFFSTQLSLWSDSHIHTWLWPPHAKSWLIGKDSDAGRDWGQEEKGTTEDEMAGWHYWLDGHESGWTPEVGDGQGGLVCCDSWGCKKSDTTEQLNWTEVSIQNLYRIGTLLTF